MIRKIGGHVSASGGIINAVSNTKKIGGNCLQIFAGSPRLWNRTLINDSDCDNFRNQIKLYDLEPVFIHGLYLVNLATDKPDLLEKSSKSLVVDMQNGDQIGANAVILHIGSHQGRGFEASVNQIASSIKQILSQSKTCNLALEVDAGQNGKIGSPEEISEIIQKVNSPRLKVCLDTAHIFASGTDLRNPQSVEQYFRHLASLGILDKVVCIHLNDSQSDFDSKRDNHANLGQGKIGLEGLGCFINHPQASHLPIILEVPGVDKTGPDKANIDIARSISK